MALMLLLRPAGAAAACIGCFGHPTHRLQPVELDRHHEPPREASFAASLASFATSPPPLPSTSPYATSADIPYNPLARDAAALEPPSVDAAAYVASFLVLLAAMAACAALGSFPRREFAWLAQAATLVRRKELPLKRQRVCTTFCELALPVLVVGALIGGAQLGQLTRADAAVYAPSPLLPFPAFARINGARNALLEALGSSVSLAPSPRRFLAVTPNTSDARALVEPIAKALPVSFYSRVSEIEQLAVDGAPLYAAVVFDHIPRDGDGAWRYSLRFPSSAVPTLVLNGVPSTSFNFDSHAVGLSPLYQQYISSGFLSLQLSLNLQILANRSANASSSAPDAFAVPFPTAAYTHAIFYDVAGNLIGLTCVFSLIVPLSTMLRAVVVEREHQLRETLFMMGTRPSAYYASIFLTYGAQFALIGLVEAALLGPAIFPHSSASLVVLTCVLFGCSAVAFALALSPFFPTARIAALVGPLLFFLSSLLYFLFLDGTVLSQDDAAGKGFSSLFPAMAFYLGASRMAQLEDGNSGVTWSNLSEGSFPFSATLLLQTLDILLWLCLAWYFEQLLPASGARRPAWFLCTPSYWGWRTGGPADGGMAAPLLAAADEAAAPLAVEPLAAPIGERGVATARLRKVYGGHVAVHSLDFEARAGEITALLGANGAGKTTTLGMLTGVVAPTSGDARIDGRRLSDGIAPIRESLGVCPQANTAFGMLTPTQHLRLFAALKGSDGEALDAAVRETLAKVGLVARRDTPARQLSGGERRKLCLGIALVGEARTLFLDEPTAAMDPHSRRAAWRLLREAREGRTLVLTTHFLDEAEALSDRVAILADGRLRCAGSLPFLKSHFGLGYTLSLVKSSAEEFDAAAVLAQVHSFEPKAALVTDSRFHAVIRLPGTSAEQLERLCAHLESPPRPLGIVEYGASHASLEDLFLQVNAAALDRLAALRHAPPPPPPPAAAIKSCPPPPAASPLAAPLAYRALLRKRWLTARRDWLVTSLQLLLPVGGVLLALLLLNIAGSLEQTSPRLPLAPPRVLAGISPPPPPILTAAAPAWGATLRRQEWRPLLVPNASAHFPAVASDLSHFLLDHASADVAAGLAIRPISRGAAARAAGRAQGDVASPLASIISAALSQQSLSSSTIASIVSAASVVPDAATAIDELTASSAASLFFNASAVHALPTLLNTLHDGLLRQATAGASSLAAASEPLPISNGAKTTLNSFASVLAAVVIVIPFAFVAASFAIPLLRERESGSKQMQFVSGATSASYWLASWTWDALAYALVLAFTMAAFFVADRREFTGSAQAVGAIVLILADYGFAVLTLSSVASFCFSTPSVGVIVILAFHLLSGFGLVVTSFVLQYIVQTSDGTQALLHGFFCLFPSYCLGQAFFTQSTSQAFGEVTGLAPPPLYAWEQLGRPLTYLLVEGFAFALLTLVLQEAAANPSLIRQLSRRFSRDAAAAAAPAVEAHELKRGSDEAGVDGEDDSVAAERAAVDAAAAEGDAPLILNHLRKVYGGGRGTAVVAVKDLCLRVHAGECFGLLGVNGAGKTTTFNMLTGGVAPTSGDATLEGVSVTQRQEEVRRRLGYCPQHHALEGRMTARETLAMYLRLRRVPSAAIDEETRALLEELDLVALADRMVATFSGGNKRKLSAAIALTGEPRLLLLDEPSAGMDAASKRFLWKVLRRRAQQCCTVLTTHSMEEVEALCDRVGVMVGGVLRCVGPIQTLKSAYSKGYSIEVRLDPARANAQEVVNFVKSKFACEVVDCGPSAVSLTVSRGDASLSQIFGQLDELKTRLRADEVSVTQSTLESVFLNMAGAPLS
ncbi:hypothetical protein AB1Y20_000498 [Prymnesium parvum]|uniref:ABC transporter domain-containing protein n=1 Tax=Prymnesium parvum TaxID=97485 RepID=A0AB34KAL6_PRYPA